jgi:heme/copper-type cytochrome/quinol oxidase subunit 4
MCFKDQLHGQYRLVFPLSIILLSLAVVAVVEIVVRQDIQVLVVVLEDFKLVLVYL